LILPLFPFIPALRFWVALTLAFVCFVLVRLIDGKAAAAPEDDEEGNPAAKDVTSCAACCC
jgi:hypothetical protein